MKQNLRKLSASNEQRFVFFFVVLGLSGRRSGDWVLYPPLDVDLATQKGHSWLGIEVFSKHVQGSWMRKLPPESDRGRGCEEKLCTICTMFVQQMRTAPAVSMGSIPIARRRGIHIQLLASF